MIYKLFFSALMLVSTSFCFAQQNEIDDQGRKQGKWVKYHPNSNVPIYEGQFIDDQPTGEFTYYYPSGKIKTIITHNHVSGRSEAYMYYENKNLFAHGIYKNKLKDSVWTHFANNGGISYRETYKNDTLNGEKLIYYIPEHKNQNSNAQVMSIQIFKKGRLHGETTEYFPDGTKKLEGTYVEGKFHGKVNRYHPDGKLHVIERWNNRTKHGWWITYDANGKEVARTYYYRGEPVEGKELDKLMKRLKEEDKSPNAW